MVPTGLAALPGRQEAQSPRCSLPGFPLALPQVLMELSWRPGRRSEKVCFPTPIGSVEGGAFGGAGRCPTPWPGCLSVHWPRSLVSHLCWPSLGSARRQTPPSPVTSQRQGRNGPLRGPPLPLSVQTSPDLLRSPVSDVLCVGKSVLFQSPLPAVVRTGLRRRVANDPGLSDWKLRARLLARKAQPVRTAPPGCSGRRLGPQGQ